MDALTVSEAAVRTGWSARMLRYLERHELVVPRRTPAGYENSTTSYPTLQAGEKARDERFMLSASVRFR